ncbi:hypothetical protein Gotur_015265 [Gossypium turneri]
MGMLLYDPKTLSVVPVVQELYASLRDQESGKAECHTWKMIHVRGKEVGITLRPKGGSLLSSLSDNFMHKSRHSNGIYGAINEVILKHNWQHFEFTQQNNIMVPNYTPDMFGPTLLEYEEAEQESKEEKGT